VQARNFGPAVETNHADDHADAQGSNAIAALVRQARGRISVMACSGVRPKNVEGLIRLTGVSEVHSACSRCAVLQRAIS
jgi:copper homeostasis protein CutC